MSELTHFSPAGDAHMVDVGDKAITTREATAEGYIYMSEATLAAIEQQGHHKGDVLGVARLAGIMAAKQTANLIPLCHPLPLTSVQIEFERITATANHSLSAGVRCMSRAKTDGKTGVEMEALTAVNIALLTIYDMCKAMDKDMRMSNIGLLEKSGGQSGHWQRATSHRNNQE